MKRVDRLIWHELLGPLVFSVFMFLVLLFTSAYLIKLTDLLVQGASMALVMKVALYSLPMLVTQTLPMGMLLGTLLAFGRLSGDSEHIALYAGGISFYRIARPIAWAGLIVGVLAIVWNETVVPPATAEMYRLQDTVLQNIKAVDKPLRYDVKRPHTDNVDEIVNIDGGYDAKTRSLRRVTIIKMSDDPKRLGQPEFMVYADRAVFRDPRGADAVFYDGYMKDMRPDPKRVWTLFHVATSQSLPKGVGLKRDFKGVMQSDITDNRRMTFVQLRDKIKEERDRSDPSADADEFDLWSKISLPLASLIFGLVAAPLGIRPQRGSKTMGFGIAIVLIFLYWVVHNWMYQYAKGGAMPPIFAAFTADGLGLVAAALLLYRTRQ